MGLKTYPYFKDRLTHLHAMVDPENAPRYYWDDGMRVISKVADTIGLRGLADYCRSQMVGTACRTAKGKVKVSSLSMCA